jgi:hypothetical protein
MSPAKQDGYAEQTLVLEEDKRPPGTIRIILEDNDDIPPNGLFIGLNGRGYILKTGVPADVPLAIKEILDNAVQLMPIMDPQDQTIIDYRPRLHYSYRTV